MLSPVASWLFAIMVSAAPPERLASAYQFQGWEETADEKRARYESIASDLAEVMFSSDVSPLESGPRGRARSAALVLAVAYHESGFAADVDKGPCFRGKDAFGRDWHERCDGGSSACMLQVKVGEGQSYEGWSREELFADRKKCFRAGYRLIQRSRRACSKLAPDLWLTAYAGGTCTNPLGQVRSRELVGQARAFVGKYPIPLDAWHLNPPPIPAGPDS